MELGGQQMIDGRQRPATYETDESAKSKIMAILGQPEPLQPTDTEDRITRIEVDTRYSPPIELLDRVEFECSRCHGLYWREVLHAEQWDEEIEVEGVMAPGGKPARYALNPTLHDYYAPILHRCVDGVEYVKFSGGSLI